jgi:peptidoglycan DL-endopeptidase LytE
MQQVAAPESRASIPQGDRPPQQTPARYALVRRRRIVLALVGLGAVALVVAFGSGSSAAWWVLLATVVVGLAYAGLLHHVRQVAAEREFAALLSPPEGDPFWGTSELRPSPAPALAAVGETDGPQAWSLLRFTASNLAGWALSPIVFALTLLLGETPRDTAGQRWLANLRGAQTRLRDQSMRTIAISAATTASVTAAGTVVALSGGATAASASTLSSATSMPATVGLPAAAPRGAAYRVVAGDTLGSIAARFGTTVAALAAANHLPNPNLIYVGQVLTLGASAGNSSPAWGEPAGASYRVVAGDTLGSIAARFGTTIAALAATNHLANPNLILVGQVLTIGGGSSATLTSSPAATPAPVASTTATGTTYRVVAGDTLGSIAARFGTTIAALAATNHLANPNLILVGQVLTIAAGDSPAAVTPAPTRTASTPAPAPVAAPSAAGVAVQVALQQVGKPYQWAGAGPNVFDCSGLVMYAWAHAGVSLPHYTVSQYEDTIRISRAELEPGDLVFYDTGDGAQPGHVTIYIGNGQIVTADSPGTVIRVEVVDWDGVPMGYGRVR